MTNRKRAWIQAGGAFVLGVCMVLLAVGCGGSDPEPEVVARPRRAPTTPPPPPRPSVTSVADLMQELGIDERVHLPEDEAPKNNDERKAILEFFDAVARGDADSLGSMLSLLDRAELDDMVASDAWAEATEGITSIDIQTGTNKYDQKCALAVVEVGFNFQPQLWYYTIEIEGPVFESATTPPGILDRLSGDWIEAWHRIIDEEIELANKHDEEFDEVDPDAEEPTGNRPSSSSAAGGGGGGIGASPGGAPGPGPSKPRRPPRRPPGPG